MKQLVNVYDFDRTIYRGDASFDFILFCMRRYPRLWKFLPGCAIALIRYIAGGVSRQQVKEVAFAFLRDVSDVESEVRLFWEKHNHRLVEWYSAKRQNTDIIISASPEFLLRPFVETLAVQALLATKMNPKTGKIDGKNCRAEEKVRRIKQFNAAIAIDACYSDSLSDMPLFNLAEHPFVVRGNAITPLAEYKPPKLQALKKPAFLRYLFVGACNASLGIIFSYCISLVVPNAVVAFVLGYAMSLVVAYFLNAIITFKEKSFSMRQFLSLCVSYIPNFLIVLTIVYLLVDVARLFPLLAYVLAAIIAAPITFLLLAKFTFTGRAQ